MTLNRCLCAASLSSAHLQTSALSPNPRPRTLVAERLLQIRIVGELANAPYDGVDLFVPIFSGLLGTHRYGRFSDSRRQLRIEALQLGRLLNSDLSLSDHTPPLVITGKS